MAIREITVPEHSKGKRLDVFLTSVLTGLSRSRLQHLIEAGEVQVNGQAKAPGYHVRSGDRIVIDVPEELQERAVLLPEEIPLDIVYEDEHLLVINKPPDLAVHPGAGRGSGTLVNALLASGRPLSNVGDPNRPGIVHRLDKDTSGLLIIAKDNQTHHALAEMIQQRKVRRQYLALIWGEPRQSSFTIDAAIGRKLSDRKQMAVVTTADRTSRHAQTEVKVLEHFGEISLIEASLGTGRTHQIRVHLSYVGHPVVGDPTYGTRVARAEIHRLDEYTQRLISTLPGQALHAYKLAFIHPINGQTMEFQSDPPEQFAYLLAHLRFRSASRG